MMKTTKSDLAFTNSGTNKSGRKHSIVDLLAIMALLRGPSGCPWDREQTGQTLKKFLIEEAYEVLEAVETGSSESLKEELGDLLLQIIFLSRIAEEKGEFDFSEVVHTLAEKLIRRHPHVFPPVDEDMKALRPKSAKEVTHIWGRIKERERKYAGRTSLFDGLPLALPALERAQKMLDRVSRTGFERKEIEPVWEKVRGELEGFESAKDRLSRKATEENFGDLLFILANWARSKGFSAEESLRKTNRRFAKRFVRMEKKSQRKRKST
jgi:MazG family protein